MMAIAVEDLISQVQQDNEYAFKQLYQMYYSKVVFFIMGIIKTIMQLKIWHKMYLSIYGLTEAN